MPRALVASAFVAFAAFGAFWGVWGASVPRVQEQASVSDGELGFALLFVGAGALPAMLLVGRALDRWGLRVAAGVIMIGVQGALAFASENAHQSWSAVFAQDELDAKTGLTSVAPAVFAATVAITRFAIGGLKPAHAQTVILAGATAAAAGALIVAAAQSLATAAAGLLVAGAGTAVLFPTLLGIVSRQVDESRRGRATSVVTVVSYLGFLLGPVYVGLWADATDLRGAMIAVAALAAALFILTPLLLRLSR